jgi:hypothetical protein
MTNIADAGLNKVLIKDQDGTITKCWWNGFNYDNPEMPL